MIIHGIYYDEDGCFIEDYYDVDHSFIEEENREIEAVIRGEPNVNY